MQPTTKAERPTRLRGRDLNPLAELAHASTKSIKPSPASVPPMVNSDSLWTDEDNDDDLVMR
jgi:hypothetical protein